MEYLTFLSKVAQSNGVAHCYDRYCHDDEWTYCIFCEEGDFDPHKKSGWEHKPDCLIVKARTLLAPTQNMAEGAERQTLIKKSIQRLQAQAKDIGRDIERDVAFIEERTELLPNLTHAKKGVEVQIAERMNRVDNLRVSLQMIALMQELLTQEQVRLRG